MIARNRSFAALLGSAALCAAVVFGPARTVHAQTQVPPDFKAVVGLGLIGGELGLVIPAALGMRDAWAYAVFPALGAVGGGVAGYFLLEANNQTDISIALLGVGMALVIPATLLTLSLSAYDPDDDIEPPAESARFNLKSARARREQARIRAGGGLLRVADGGVWLGAPAVGPVASATSAGGTAVRFGVSDFQLALVSGSF